MKALLKKLDTETFILDCRDDLQGLPTLDGFDLVQIDNHSLEVTLDKNQDINEVFKLLDQQDIKIKSMRNKTNRLEQLFVSLLQNSANRAAATQEGRS